MDAAYGAYVAAENNIFILMLRVIPMLMIVRLRQVLVIISVITILLLQAAYAPYASSVSATAT